MYNKYNLISAKKILSHLNLDINSSTQGSFDRYYWSWKKRDFQDSTLSFAVNPLINSGFLSEEDNNYMLQLTVENLVKIQKYNGSFDQSYPNENHPKTGLDFGSVYYNYLVKNSNKQVEKSYELLLEYSLKKEEDYGVICNHLAHHMYEYLLGYKYFNHKKYYEKAKENLYLILNHTSKEGWHQEYLSADAGYQTRTLRYLVKSYELFIEQEQEVCLSLAKKSIEFLDKIIMPDGSICSAFGSRNTSLIYPSGIEFMAYKFPKQYSSLCERIRKAIEQEIVSIPISLDFDNFIRLYDDFQSAQYWYSKNSKLEYIDENRFEYDMPEYGIKKVMINEYSIYLQYKFGGQLAIYKNDKEYYKNAGYLLKYKNKWFGTKNLTSIPEITKDENSITVKNNLFESIHQEVTPLKQIVLRVLNLTVLRFELFSDLFRKFIVKFLISGSDKQTIGVFKRRVEFKTESVYIKDEIQTSIKTCEIYSTKYIHLFHMASSRYFNPLDKCLNNSLEKINSLNNEKIIILKKGKK